MAKIVILGKDSGCAPCSELKSMLEMFKQEYTFYDVGTRGDVNVATLKKYMMANKITDIPAVWVDGEFVGAGSEEAFSGLQGRI